MAGFEALRGDIERVRAKQFDEQQRAETARNNHEVRVNTLKSAFREVGLALSNSGQEPDYYNKRVIVPASEKIIPRFFLLDRVVRVDAITEEVGIPTWKILRTSRTEDNYSSGVAGSSSYTFDVYHAVGGDGSYLVRSVPCNLDEKKPDELRELSEGLANLVVSKNLA